MSALTISRSSWHYRFWKWGHRNFDPDAEPRDLCSYFWGIVGIVFAHVMLLMPLVLIALLVLLIVAAFSDPWILAWVALGLALFALLLVGVVALIYFGARLYERIRPSSSKVTGALSLVRAVVVARKRRICPLIEVRDENTVSRSW